MTHQTFLNLFVPIFTAVIGGGYAYTYTATKDLAGKEDIEDLRTRLNILYEGLIGEKIEDALERKRGKEKN